MYDLCLNAKSSKEKDRHALLVRMAGLGWQAVAWNTNAIGKVNPALTRPLKPIVLDNAQLLEAHKYRSFLEHSSHYSHYSHSSSKNSINNSSAETTAASVPSASTANNIRQFSRVTVVVDDILDAQSLSTGNEALKQFDIVAVRPGNSKVFSYLCKQAEVDIIDLTQSSADINFSKKMLDEAVARGIFFEINYLGIISNPTSRRDLLSKAKLLVQYLRGRNIIITSSADSYNQVRGPHDVINMAKVLQLSDENAIKSIKEKCVKLIQHAYSRKLRYLPVEILPNGEFKEKFPELSIILKSSRSQWSSTLEISSATTVEKIESEQLVGNSSNSTSLANDESSDSGKNSDNMIDSADSDNDSDSESSSDIHDAIDSSDKMDMKPLGREDQESESDGVLLFNSKSSEIKSQQLNKFDRDKDVNESDDAILANKTQEFAASFSSESDGISSGIISFGKKNIYESRELATGENNKRKQLGVESDNKKFKSGHNNNSNNSNNSHCNNFKLNTGSLPSQKQQQSRIKLSTPLFSMSSKLSPSNSNSKTNVNSGNNNNNRLLNLLQGKKK